MNIRDRINKIALVIFALHSLAGTGRWALRAMAVINQKQQGENSEGELFHGVEDKRIKLTNVLRMLGKLS